MPLKIMVRKRALEFKCGCTSTDNDPCNGCQKSPTTPNAAATVHKYFYQDLEVNMIHMIM